MAEENNEGFPGVQVSKFITGDQFVFRANSGKELEELLAGVAENIEGIVGNLVNVAQGVVAKNVFTGNGEKGGGTSPKSGGTTGRKATNGRAKDAAPPSDDISYWEEDGEKWASVECKHGFMKDLRDRGYKSDLYCASKDRKNQCPPVKL